MCTLATAAAAVVYYYSKLLLFCWLYIFHFARSSAITDGKSMEARRSTMLMQKYYIIKLEHAREIAFSASARPARKDIVPKLHGKVPSRKRWIAWKKRTELLGKKEINPQRKKKRSRLGYATDERSDLGGLKNGRAASSFLPRKIRSV